MKGIFTPSNEGPSPVELIKAKDLYNQKKPEGMQFDSQCLGVIEVINGVYAVDIVHVPRSSVDNLPENQCELYRNGSVGRFIELDKDGNVVRGG